MTKLEEDAALFLGNAEALAGLSKRDVQKEMFRLKREMKERYDFSVEGFEEDYEARLSTGDEDDDHAEFVVDLRGGETEINAFVVIDDEAVVNEVRGY
jgi:hypothetical protein